MSSARSVTISSSDGSVRDRIDDVDVPGDATRLVLRDGDGREHHFGRHSQREMFAHVATYLPDGSRDEYFPYWELQEALDEPFDVVDEPELGPRLAPLARHAFADMTRTTGTHKGFAFDYEKGWAVRTLRALHHAAGISMDPEEVEAYALTLGWRVKDARELGTMTARVQEGKNFMSVGRKMIRRDPDVERRTVEMWRKDTR
jgi:hypothetical protein